MGLSDAGVPIRFTATALAGIPLLEGGTESAPNF